MEHIPVLKLQQSGRPGAAQGKLAASHKISETNDEFLKLSHLERKRFSNLPLQSHP